MLFHLDNIFFDDAFQRDVDDNGDEISVGEGKVNKHAKTLIDILDTNDFGEHFNQKGKQEVVKVDINRFNDKIITPFGGRIDWQFQPSGNILRLHLKDKTKIRKGKRFSQVYQNIGRMNKCSQKSYLNYPWYLVSVHCFMRISKSELKG